MAGRGSTVTVADYCGAGALLEPAKAFALGSRWGYQVKVDGCYARATTDRAGRITQLLSRAGAQIASDLIGCMTGLALATLHGELEAFTEAGARAARACGFALLHLYDVTQVDGRACRRLEYRARYALLQRSQAIAELDGRTSPWSRDAEGRHHDLAGRWCRPVPRDLRRCPVLATAYGAAGKQLWRDHVELGGGEGLVAVALDAPAGRRGSKRKIKATDHLDCRVVAVDGDIATLEYGGRLFAVRARGRAAVGLQAGAVAEVAHNGWYEAGATPRFPRVTRIRHDLMTAMTIPC